MDRRKYIGCSSMVGTGALLGLQAAAARAATPLKKPNIVYVFADQWRASALGYAGNPDVKTPNIDALAQESFNFKNAVSNCPVCSPARGSIITGQYPLTHGVFLNDVQLKHSNPSIADCFNEAGYETGYIGKWHLDGRGRSAYIPPGRRQGFKSWQALECTHNYNHSKYYDNNDPEIKKWKDYDAFSQTQAASEYIRENKDKPFMLFLSWGPPHGPYLTAPKYFQDQYDPATLQLRPNVPRDSADFIPPQQGHELWEMEPRARIRGVTAGYYAHCTALDECVGMLQKTIRAAGLEENTIFIFTSDHGDMLGSHGLLKKQWVYDESARVPFLLKYPALSSKGVVETPINTPDLMPTLCELAGVPIPSSVEGTSYASELRSGKWPAETAALLANYHPFGQVSVDRGGKEWRAIRTERYTYARDLHGEWLLFDNEQDPYQMNNLLGQPEHEDLRLRMKQLLQQKLDDTDDSFEKGMVYVDRWNYKVNQHGSVPYTL